MLCFPFVLFVQAVVKRGFASPCAYPEGVAPGLSYFGHVPLGPRAGQQVLKMTLIVEIKALFIPDLRYFALFPA